jgi:SRSO17 transposase
VRRDRDHQPVSALDLAKRRPVQAWPAVPWREGTNAPLTSRFAAVRVRPAHRDPLLHEPRAEEGVLIEGPEGEKEPTTYWLSTLSPDRPLADLVEPAKLRWRIERDFQELKQEMGLGPYEGRGWRGVHHHAALCIAAYGFLVSQRGRVPPSGPQTAIPPAPRLPESSRPRGAPPQTGAPR